MTTATKFIGNYLVEAGLISSAQVSLISSDQATTKMRSGEIVVNRGWLKTQTIEFVMAHVISPKQSALRFEDINLEPRQLKPEHSHLQEQSVLFTVEKLLCSQIAILRGVALVPERAKVGGDRAL